MANQSDDVRTQVADYVRYWRSHAGLSIADVIDTSGVSRSKWSEIENGKGDQPKPETLGAVARAINRDPGELLAIIGLRAPGVVGTDGPPAAGLVPADSPSSEGGLPALQAEVIRLARQVLAIDGDLENHTVQIAALDRRLAALERPAPPAGKQAHR